jgi:hypothetical protein
MTTKLFIHTLLIALFTATPGWCSGKGTPDKHDSDYTYRGGPIASREAQSVWDAANRELAAQDRATDSRRGK